LLLIFFAALAIACAKRANSSAAAPQEPPFVLLNMWGAKGDGPGKLNKPVTFTADTRGRIYFADTAQGYVHKFEANGTPLLSFEDPRIRSAAGIAVDSGGAIYVLDAQHGNVLIYFPDGEFLRSMRVPALAHFSGILGITVDAEGDLYVPDPNRSRIQRFDSHGKLIKVWNAPPSGAPSQKPASIVVAPDDSLFVTYSGSARIDKFSRDGSLVTSWNAASNTTPSGSTDATAIAELAANSQFVFTIGAQAAEIGVWTPDGMHVLDFADGLTDINMPLIAVTPDSELLVFDAASVRVFRFRIQVKQTSHQIAEVSDSNAFASYIATCHGRKSCNFWNN
jgi:hypothetical protein